MLGELAERTEEEVLDKYEVEDSTREAYRGRGKPLETEACWQKQEMQNQRVGRKLLGKNLRQDREYNLQRRQSVHGDSTEE